MKNDIKKLRRKRGLTAKKLGELIGASQSVISRVENEKQELDVNMMQKIARVLKVSEFDLIGGTPKQIKKDKEREKEEYRCIQTKLAEMQEHVKFLMVEMGNLSKSIEMKYN